jgi:hypothetical protein
MWMNPAMKDSPSTPTAHRHKEVRLGYGLKFWPEDVEKLKSANPHLAWFAD